MKIQYVILEEEGILIQKFGGGLDFKKYFTHASQIPEIIQGKTIKIVINDFRELKYDIVPKDFDNIVEKMTRFRKQQNKKLPNVENIPVVFWVSEPLPTVIAHIFRSNFPEIEYHYCSTEEGIRRVVDIPASVENLNETILKIVPDEN